MAPSSTPSALADRLRFDGHDGPRAHPRASKVPTSSRASRPGRTRSRRRRRSPRPSGWCSTPVDLYNPRAGRDARPVLDDLPSRRRAHERGAGAVERRAHLARPTRRRRTSTRSTTTGCCASATRWCTATVGSATPRCRSCVGISWIRNEALRHSPPGVVLAVSHAIAAEHEQTGVDAVSDCGCSTTRSRSSRVDGHARGAGAAAHVRIPRPARHGQGHPHAARGVRPGRTRRRPARRRRAGARSRPTSAAPGRVRRRRRLGRPGAQGGAARRGRLPRRAVAVEGPGAGRPQRGAWAGHPGDRGGDRRHPGADRARVPRRCCSPPATSPRSPRGWRPTPRAREHFRPDPAAAPIDWSGHLAGVLAAYADAAGPPGPRDSRPDHGAWPLPAPAPKIT